MCSDAVCSKTTCRLTVAWVTLEGLAGAELLRPAGRAIGGRVRLPQLVEGGEVPRGLDQMEPAGVGHADPVGHRFRQAIGPAPDDLSAEDKSELIDAADGVSLRRQVQRLVGVGIAELDEQ